MKQIASEFAPNNIGLQLKVRRSSIKLEDDSEILLSTTPEELASLKMVFNSFDVEKRGFIIESGYTFNNEIEIHSIL